MTRYAVDVYTAPPDHGLMPAHPVAGPNRNWQLATLDALTDQWGASGYVTGWAAAGVLVAHDARGALRHVAIAREADE